jgi:hypothetical protein
LRIRWQAIAFPEDLFDKAALAYETAFCSWTGLNGTLESSSS